MKYFYYIFLGILVAAAVSAAAFFIFVPSYIERKIEASVSESCDGCSIEIERTSVSLLSPGRWILKDAHFKGGDPSASSYDVHVDEITMAVELRSLLNRHLHVKALDITNPSFTLVDGEGHSKRSKDDDSLKYRLENIRVTNGVFTYVRNYRGTHAVLHLGKVEVKADIFGNEDDLKGKPLSVNSSFVIEQSGSIDMKINTYMFADGPLKVDTNIKVKDQDLGRLTSFFRPNAGVVLEGKMLSGAGTAKVRGTRLDAEVTSAFKDLKITLEKEVERTEAEAFLENIGLAIDANKENLSKPIEDRTRTVTTTREPNERIVGFILRGLKEAALKVARAD